MKAKTYFRNVTISFIYQIMSLINDNIWWFIITFERIYLFWIAGDYLGVKWSFTLTVYRVLNLFKDDKIIVLIGHCCEFPCREVVLTWTFIGPTSRTNNLLNAQLIDCPQPFSYCWSQRQTHQHFLLSRDSFWEETRTWNGLQQLILQHLSRDP